MSPSASDSVATDVEGSQQAAGSEGVMYGATFWLAYAANTALMVCVSLLFRYADFITLRGGDEWTLGLVAGVGMVGALAMRLFLGSAIDHYGAHRVWVASLLVILAALALHLWISTVHSPWIYGARIILMVGQAGAFGASITFMSLRAAPGRLGEMVGMLGSSGFIGIALGPTLGDWLFSGSPPSEQHVFRMFTLAMLACVVSLVCTLAAVRNAMSPPHTPRPNLYSLLKSYHPGWILLVAAAMGLAVMLPHTFLRPYTVELRISGIRTFFIAYAASAFTIRLITRRFTDRLGFRPVILMVLGVMSLSMFSYIFVRNEAWLALPAVLGGISHAYLFPAVVTAGSLSFPMRFRGLATTLVLAMFDVGNLLGQPIIGGVVKLSPSLGLPPFATMFSLMALAMLSTGVIYFLFGQGGNETATEAMRLTPQESREEQLIESTSDF